MARTGGAAPLSRRVVSGAHGWITKHVRLYSQRQSGSSSSMMSSLSFPSLVLKPLSLAHAHRCVVKPISGMSPSGSGQPIDQRSSSTLTSNKPCRILSVNSSEAMKEVAGLPRLLVQDGAQTNIAAPRYIRLESPGAENKGGSHQSRPVNACQHKTPWIDSSEFTACLNVIALILLLVGITTINCLVLLTVINTRLSCASITALVV